MCKKGKEYMKTLENMYNKKKLAVYDKKSWPFDQWIGVCYFKRCHPVYIYIYIYQLIT